MAKPNKAWKSKRSLWLTRLGFLSLALLLWLLMELSQAEFNSVVEVPVRLDNQPQDQMIVNAPERIKVISRAEGVFAFRERFKEQDQLVLPFDEFESEGLHKFYLTKERFDAIARNYTSNSVDWELAVDTFWLEASNLQRKLVPVRVGIQASFKEPYYKYGKPVVEPDLVFIFGTAEELDTITSLRVPAWKGVDINEDIDFTWQVELSERLSSPTEEIHIHQTVVPYTEKELNVEIGMTNAGGVWTTVPRFVQLTCKVPLSEYGRLGPNQFEAQVMRLDHGDAQVPVRWTRVPDYVEIVDWTPRYVEIIQNK